MSFFDKVKQALSKHEDKVSDGLDKAAAAIDDKTGGAHSDKIATGVEKAKDALDKLDGKTDGPR